MPGERHGTTAPRARADSGMAEIRDYTPGAQQVAPQHGPQHGPPAKGGAGEVETWLEGEPQRKLNEARRAHGRENLPERSTRDDAVAGAAVHARSATGDGLDVGDGGIGKVGVIPDVEEVRGEAQIHALSELESLEQREVPALLERTAERVASKCAEHRDRAVAA